MRVRREQVNVDIVDALIYHNIAAPITDAHTPAAEICESAALNSYISGIADADGSILGRSQRVPSAGGRKNSTTGIE